MPNEPEITLSGTVETLMGEVVILNRAYMERTIHVSLNHIVYVEMEGDDDLLVNLTGRTDEGIVIVNDDSPGCARLREVFGLPHPDDVAEYDVVREAE